MLEVTAIADDILVTRIRHTELCSTGTNGTTSTSLDNVLCYQREFMHQRKCLSTSDNDKFLVEHNDGMYEVRCLNLGKIGNLNNSVIILCMLYITAAIKRQITPVTGNYS